MVILKITVQVEKNPKICFPRFGFNYDVKTNQPNYSGGTGIFLYVNPFVWLTNMPTNAGVLQNTIEPGSCKCFLLGSDKLDSIQKIFTIM